MQYRCTFHFLTLHDHDDLLFLWQLNVDADIVRQHAVSNVQAKMVQLQNGCICCTLREDLLVEVLDLNDRYLHKYTYPRYLHIYELANAFILTCR